MSVEYYKKSFLTVREVELYKAYLELRTIQKVAKRFGLGPSAVSKSIKNVKEKIERAKKTIEIAVRELNYQFE
ncbi:MAG: LacI family DNA-binding transcriptional regulator [Candidatus Odinarchaeota archaeon]|nr:LacI family DNA-binding transcriptional regulator [Candidatus Odinarchaeota archaeon]